MKVVNKYNLPVIFFIGGMLFSLLLTIVGGVAFSSAHWGILCFGATATLTVLWYVGLWVVSAMSGKTEAPKQTSASIAQDDDGWE